MRVLEQFCFSKRTDLDFKLLFKILFENFFRKKMPLCQCVLDNTVHGNSVWVDKNRTPISTNYNSLIGSFDWKIFFAQNLQLAEFSGATEKLIQKLLTNSQSL